MNDEQRAALVEELTKAQHDAWPGVDADFIVNTEAIMPIIDRLLADRTMPDGDAVEAAAKAMLPYEVPTDALRRALTAAAPGAGLDELLPYDWNFEVRYEGEGMSTLPWLGRPEPTEDEVYYAQVGPWDAHASGYFGGTGPTRTAAIQAAVAEAKKGAGQ